jgi:hypothetical protein
MKLARKPERSQAGRPLTALANIGKVTERKLKQIGIRSAEDFLRRDPYQVFEELRQKVDPTLCRCALAVLVGARLGQPWHRITKASAREFEKRHPGHEWGPC